MQDGLLWGGGGGGGAVAAINVLHPLDDSCAASYHYRCPVRSNSDNFTSLQRVGAPEGLAVDWLNNHLYWTESVFSMHHRFYLASKHKSGSQNVLLAVRISVSPPLRSRRTPNEITRLL